MDLGKILRAERIKQGLSQRALADMAGVTKRSIIYWENGEKGMSVESADKIFKALHMTITLGDETLHQQGTENIKPVAWADHFRKRFERRE